jgi:ABC-2 type transport system permease protein
MPLWTTLGSLFFPLGIAFLLFVSKNPAISQKLGLISAKANLVGYSATDWPTYMVAYGQIIALGEFFLLILAVSWIFGREFADGTLKDMLAVPVQRSKILLSKFIVLAFWAALLTVVIFIAGLVMGVVLKLPGASTAVILQGSGVVVITACLTTASVLPYALFASIGRGYLLPIGLAVLTLMITNLAVIIGRGEFFPWAIPMLYAQGTSSLAPISYWLVIFTGLAGMLLTYLWWKYADQNR